ncbi:unnamed protein product [Camellia sinensis]
MRSARNTTSTTSTSRNISTFTLPSTPTLMSLFRLAIKKVKGLSTEELAARNDLVLALPDRIQAVLDGTAATPKIWRLDKFSFPHRNQV